MWQISRFGCWNAGLQKLLAPATPILVAAMDSHKFPQASINNATKRLTSPLLQQPNPPISQHIDSQVSARQHAQQEAGHEREASSGNPYLDAIVQGTGMVRLPSLSPNHRAHFSNDMTQGPNSPRLNAHDLQASRCLGLQPQPGATQGLKSAMKGSRLQATSSPAQHELGDNTDTPTGSIHASESSASTSDLLTQTLQDMDDAPSHDRGADRRTASHVAVAQPGRDSRRASGNILLRLASRLGVSQQASNGPVMPERTLHSELSLRDRYGMNSGLESAGVSRVSSISRLPFFSPSQQGSQRGPEVEAAGEGSISRIPSISMMPSVRSSMESDITGGDEDLNMPGVTAEHHSQAGLDVSALSSFTAESSQPLPRSATVETITQEQGMADASSETIKAVGGIGRQRLPPGSVADPRAPFMSHGKSGLLLAAAETATIIGSSSTASQATSHTAASQPRLAGFVVRPAPASTLRAGRVPSMGTNSMSSQGSMAAQKPVGSIFKDKQQQRDPVGARKQRLFRGATLGGLITKVGLASRRASKEQPSHGKQRMGATGSSRASQDHKVLSPGGNNEPGSKSTSQEQTGKASGRGSTRRPHQMQVAISRTRTMGGPHASTADARQHERRLGSTAARPNKGGGAVGEHSDTEGSRHAGARRRQLPRMFSLKRDFWTLRGAARSTAAK